MKSFKDVTKNELEDLRERMIQEAIEWSEEVQVSSLSVTGMHNIYRGIEDMLNGEYAKSQKVDSRVEEILKEEEREYREKHKTGGVFK